MDMSLEDTLVALGLEDSYLKIKNRNLCKQALIFL